MNNAQSETNSESPIGNPETEALLHRILDVVEKDKRRGRLELAIAIILSLATLGSTWCGYQANQWGSIENKNRAAAGTAERQAAEDTIIGLQMRTFDGIELLAYWTALRQNDTETANRILTRMRPQLREAVEASLAAGALHDPNAIGPLQRPEYVLVEEQNAKRRREEALQLTTTAQDAAKNSDAYVTVTLMFASVLFFGGITGTFTARRVRIGLAWAALGLFIVASIVLFGLPVSTS